MIFLTTLCLKFLLFSNFLLAETMPINYKILKQSSECLQYSQNQECRELISQIEKLQLVELNQKRYKCQSSLLGLQSELIESYFLKSFSNERISLMIPYVIKNCKLLK